MPKEESEKPTALAQRRIVQPDPESRGQRLAKAGVLPSMPPNPSPWHVELLMEIGPTMAAGMGPTIVTWEEIDRWCARTGVDLEPWESKLLRRLSGDYIAESARAREPACLSPWQTEPTERRREVVEQRVRGLFSDFKAARKGK